MLVAAVLLACCGLPLYFLNHLRMQDSPELLYPYYESRLQDYGQRLSARKVNYEETRKYGIPQYLIDHGARYCTKHGDCFCITFGFIVDDAVPELCTGVRHERPAFIPWSTPPIQDDRFPAELGAGSTTVQRGVDRAAHQVLEHLLVAQLSATAAEPLAFELGTGWFPILPVAFHLCGAREIWTTDIESFLRPRQLAQMLDYFAEFHRNGKLAAALPAARADRIEQLLALAPKAATLTPQAWLAELKIHALNQDAQRLPLADASIDWFFSSGVLEYIPEPVLRNILAEFRRLATPGAVMTHRLNLADEYSYFDRNITTLNFLKFDDRRWRWFNSPLIWQSRLRVSDYRRLYREAGFAVVAEHNQSEASAKLDQFTLAPQFKKYAREDLLVIHSFMVGQLATQDGARNLFRSDASATTAAA